jgi:cobalt/nickel transport system ATP-binding protein
VSAASAASATSPASATSAASGRLEVRATRLGYRREVPVLRDVDLVFHRGERVVLLGGNGAGKSALLQWMAGVLPRQGGSCTVDGAEVSSPRQAVAAGIGLLVQDPDDHLLGSTVREDVELGPQNLGLPAEERRARVAEALAAVAIEALAEREIETLSLGERKRAALAGVLAMRPRWLLLDEPTAGLEPAAEERLDATLRALADAGIAVVCATHAIDWAARFASRVIVLGGGAVLADGAPREVLVREELLRDHGLRSPWPTALWRALLHRRAPAVTLTEEEVLACLQSAFS